MWQWWSPMMGHFKVNHQFHRPLTMAGVSSTVQGQDLSLSRWGAASELTPR